MGYGGPVALNGMFINQAMDDYRIDESERIEFSLRVRQIARIIFNAQAKEAAEKLKTAGKK